MTAGPVQERGAEREPRRITDAATGLDENVPPNGQWLWVSGKGSSEQQPDFSCSSKKEKVKK